MDGERPVFSANLVGVGFSSAAVILVTRFTPLPRRRHAVGRSVVRPAAM
jgi:hypothetical protein